MTSCMLAVPVVLRVRMTLVREPWLAIVRVLTFTVVVAVNSLRVEDVLCRKENREAIRSLVH